MQDAQLISQAGLVESLASDGLVSVSTGAGQPQKNMELAKFADSLGSSVPLQQTSEQVGITGLYARTSDGKMVELTSDSVAKVMAKIAGKEDVSVDIQIGKDNCRYEHDVDANELFSSSFVDSCTNLPEGFVMGFIKVVRTEATKGLIQLFFERGDSSALYSRYYNGSSWGSWRRIDNFGYNTLAELSSGVAEQMTTGKLFPFMTRGVLSKLGNPPLNDVVDSGMYVISNNAMYGEFANLPLNVYIPYPGVIVQVVYSTSGIQSRFRDSEGVWTSWSK